VRDSNPEAPVPDPARSRCADWSLLTDSVDTHCDLRFAVEGYESGACS